MTNVAQFCVIDAPSVAPWSLGTASHHLPERGLLRAAAGSPPCHSANRPVSKAASAPLCETATAHAECSSHSAIIFYAISCLR